MPKPKEPTTQYTVDEQELLSVYRSCRDNKYKGGVYLHFGGDGDEPFIKVDLLEIKGREVIDLLANKTKQV